MAFDKTEFYRAFGDYAGVPSDVTITGITEEMEYGGYCETCRYEELATYVSGTRADGDNFYQKVYVSLADFTNSL